MGEKTDTLSPYWTVFSKNIDVPVPEKKKKKQKTTLDASTSQSGFPVY